MPFTRVAWNRKEYKMPESIIKVGFCVAYDWQLLKISVPLIYQHADLICFSIDSQRKTWSGIPYDFDQNDFETWINQIDLKKKILIFEGNFSNTVLSPLQNDNLQRNEMAKIMGPGGWHIQIDADEYILDFAGFCEYLKRLDPDPIHGRKKGVNVCINLIPLLKFLGKGYIAAGADENYEVAPFATNLPIYHAARRNGHFNHISPFFALHETWARDEKVLWDKLNSWGHRDDFNKESYYKLWQALDEANYKYIKNFHPIKGDTWPFLYFLPATSQEQLISFVKHSAPWKVKNLKLMWRNSRLIQGLSQRLNT